MQYIEKLFYTIDSIYKQEHNAPKKLKLSHHNFSQIQNFQILIIIQYMENWAIAFLISLVDYVPIYMYFRLYKTDFQYIAHFYYKCIFSVFCITNRRGMYGPP